MDLLDILDYVKKPIQTANEKFDSMEPIYKTGIISVPILIGLLLTGKAFMFIAVAIVAAQRILFHGGVFKEDEDYESAQPDEDEKDSTD